MTNSKQLITKTILVLLIISWNNLSFTQVGSTCANPEFITTLPLSQTGNTTAGFGDDYSTNSCNNSYMGGDDFVYSFTPTTTTTVSVTLSNTGSWVGLFVFDGCPNSGTCTASNTSSSGNPSINSVTLTGGTTYYIVISTYPSPQSTAFDINISEVLPFIDMVSGTNSITSCDYTFRDNSGASNYTNNFSGTTTLVPGSSGQMVQLDFSLFDSESNYDKVWIYNGPTDASPALVTAYSGNGIPPGNPFLSTAAGGEITVKFISDGSSTKSGWNANVTCVGAPSCDPPTTLGASNITPTSASLYWTETGTATVWDIELGTNGFAPTGTPTDNDLTQNPYTYNSLLPSTAYDYYVRSDCGGLQSTWTGPFVFITTACDIQAPTNLTATTITSVSADLGWTENGNSTVWDIELGTQGFSPAGTPTANNVTSNPYMYTGLSATTAYDYYVRSNCSTSNSAWVGPFAFTTTSVPNNYVSEMTSGWARSVTQGPDGNYVWAGSANSDFYVVKTTQGGSVIWAKTFGGTGSDAGYDVVNSGDGGYVVIGHTNSASLVVSGSYDIMITKLDVNGNHVWSRIIGTSSSEYSSECSIIKNTDGTYAATVTTDNDMGFIHIAANGTILAMKTLNTQSATGKAIVQATGTNGGWVVGGKYNGPLGNEYMLNKIKSDGTFDWSMVWGDGTGTNEYVYAIVENSANDYTVFGVTYVEGSTPNNMYAVRFTNSTGTPTAVWIKAYGTTVSSNFKDATIAADGNYIVVGSQSSAGAGSYSDTYLMKLNAADGSIIWQTEKIDDGTSNRQGDGVFIDNAGSYLVAGLGGFDMLKFAPDGTICDGFPGVATIDDLGVTFPNLDGTEGLSNNTFGATNASKAPTFTNFGTLQIGCNVFLLPVEFTDFKAECTSNGNLLTWSTLTELNNDYFIIEKSTSGQSFENIGSINGFGNSSSKQEYKFSDKSINEAPIVYYRITQVDFDGKTKTTKIISTTCNQTELSIYPNPFTNQITIKLSSEINSPLTLNITNNLGQIVYSKIIDNKTKTVKLNLNEALEIGTYYIQLHNEYTFLIKKIIKTK